MASVSSYASTSSGAGSRKLSIDIPKAPPSLVTPPSHAHGAFTPTHSASDALRYLHASSRRSFWRKRRPIPDCFDDSGYASSSALPSISRTSSCTDGSQSPTSSTATLLDEGALPSPDRCHAKSVEAHVGGKHHQTWGAAPAGRAAALRSGTPHSVRQRADSDLNPVLARLERDSRICAGVSCATCGRSGQGFPKCPRCSQQWCSRECRMPGGKRHACRAAA
ncbi:hypothetical protein HDZ31DRAFT_66952 [Schizophyllum fasciatum]